MADDQTKVTEEVKEEIKEEVKEEVAEAKEEVKEEVKEELKEEIKEEVKEEVKEAVKEEKVKEVKVSKKLEEILTGIEKLSVMELADLVKALEEKFGVSAAASMAVAAPTGAPAAGGDSAPAEEQTTFNVVLANAGANKISVIKAVREINQTLGLKEAKDLVEAAPKEVLTGVNKSNAQEAKTKLEAAGATVELK